MTVAEYVAIFLRENGISTVFAIQGGGSARLIDALGFTDGIEYVCNQHEQASAMSADGYARASGGIGCALSTSGPGATNLLTGCVGSYFDSIPVLFITGQVSSFRLKGSLGVRCMHTQETDVVDIFSSVTKYAVALNNPNDIRYELEKCLYISKEGRPGPVLIDIPDNYQREEIDIDQLRMFDGYDNDEELESNFDVYTENLCSLIRKSKRPIIIAGWGVHLSNAEDELVKFSSHTKIPVVFTWGANDILSEDDPLKVGTLGMNGSKAGNYAVRDADCIIIIGARLDQHTIIVSHDKFGSDAKKVCIDIDEKEIDKIEKLGGKLDMKVHADAKTFLRDAIQSYCNKSFSNRDDWIELLCSIKNEHKSNLPLFHVKDAIVSPYMFFRELSESIEEEAIIFADTGSSLVWFEQYFKTKKGQRFHSSLNNTPMGYALPAAIGAAIATKSRVYSINGDGGLQMNIQELATVIRHNLDIKIILFDNEGYGMVQRTQDTYMGSRYEGTDVKSGLAFPDFEKLFLVYGFDVSVIDDNINCKEILYEAFSKSGPGCIIVKTSINEDYETFYADDIASNF